MTQETYYHASGIDLGKQFTFDEGGFYERTTNGVPEMKLIGGEYCGWKHSETEQFCASKSPEAAAFAKLKHIAEGGGNTDTAPSQVFIYELTKQPDVDLTKIAAGDFAFIEEVRYDSPSENPIDGTRCHTLEFSNKVAGDVDLAYLPPGPYIIDEWAEAIKDAIRQYINTGEYPTDVCRFSDTARPDIGAYRPEYA